MVQRTHSKYAPATRRLEIGDLNEYGKRLGDENTADDDEQQHLAGEDRATYAFLSDGEMEEGQVWEAAMFASHNRRRMGRLAVVIDANNSQVDGAVTSVTNTR